MLRRAFLRLFARIAIAGVLFAQGAIVLAACEMPRRAPAQALAEADQHCHDAKGEANLCLAHCLADDQTSDKPPSQPPAFAPVLVLRVQLTAFLRAPDAVQRRLPHPPAAAPPRILFLSLLI